MALPLIKTPVYELTLPVKQETIKYRPFLVKEQKILMLALESNDIDFINDNIKQVIKNCSITNVNVDSLCSIDIEYFFLHLRARSMGEVIESKFRCKNTVINEDNESFPCNNLLNLDINLLDINVDFHGGSNIINLSDGVGIKLKYPDLEVAKSLDFDNPIDSVFEIVLKSIDFIFDNDSTYYPDNTNKEEFISFIESLNVEQFKLIQNFFENLPTLEKQFQVKCPKCGFEHNIKLKGIKDFLA